MQLSGNLTPTRSPRETAADVNVCAIALYELETPAKPFASHKPGRRNLQSIQFGLFIIAIYYLLLLLRFFLPSVAFLKDIAFVLLVRKLLTPEMT